MNGKNYLGGLKYYLKLNYANGRDFFDFIAKYFEKVPFNKEKIVGALKNKIEELENIKGTINQEKALNILIARDLGKFLKAAEKNKIEEPEPKIARANKFFQKKLKELDLESSPYEIFIVDKFPSIWHGTEDIYSALGIASGYQKYYDVQPGNYLLRKRLLPIYSDGIILPHEIMHQVINFYSDREFGRGLEEGICDLFGAYLGSQLYNFEVTKNWFIYARHTFPLSRVSSDYYYFFRQACYIYLNFGFKGLIALIKKGRLGIRQVEQYLHAGQFEKINLPKGNWDKKLTDLVNYISLTYVPNLVVSPLACYVADFIKAGDDINELTSRLDLDKKQTQKAVKELADIVDVIQVNKNKINYSVLPYILKSQALRYKIKLR